MTRRTSRTILLAVALGLFGTVGRADDLKAVPQPPAKESFLIIPVRVHVLKSKVWPEIDCALGDEDVFRIFKKVNAVWSKAGIYWSLESIVREEASESKRFDELRGLDSPPPLESYAELLPPGSRDFRGLHVYYLHDFSVNGVWLGGDTALVKETASLREVEGGIDEPLPRVTAHELGHTLGLPHRQDRLNLLASGTTGTTLNAAEVETARLEARKIDGMLTYDEFSEALKQAERRPEAAETLFPRLRRGLSEIAELQGK